MRDKIVEIGRDSAWYLVAYVAAAFLGFLAVPIFTRLFGPSQYGVYSLVSISIIMGSPIFSLWLVNSIIRFYPEYEKRGELDVFYTTALHKVPHVMFLFLLVLLPLSVFILPLGEYRLLVSLGIAVFAFLVTFRVLLGALRARQRSWQFALLRVFVQFGRYIVGAALVSWFHMGVEGPFWGWLGALLLAVPLEFAALGIGKHLERGKYSRDLEREFIRFGFPLILVTVLTEVLTAADRYMVQIFKGSAQVGLYAVVYTLVSSIEAILGSIILLGATPVVMKVYENDGEEATVTLIGGITRYFIILLVPTAVGIWVLGTRVISVITSPAYMPATEAVLPLAAGLLLSNALWLPALAFHVKKKTNVVLIPTAVATVVNIAINLVLIPRYGFSGAAWATLISYVLCFVLVVVYALRYMRWEFPYASAARVAVASGVMGVCVYVLEKVMTGGWGGLALLILIGAMIYGACLLAFREFTGPELRFAASVVVRSREYLLDGGWHKRHHRKDK